MIFCNHCNTPRRNDGNPCPHCERPTKGKPVVPIVLLGLGLSACNVFKHPEPPYGVSTTYPHETAEPTDTAEPKDTGAQTRDTSDTAVTTDDD